MADIIDVNIGDQVLEVYWQDEVELNLDMNLMYIKSGQKEIQDYVDNVSKPEINSYIKTEAKPIVTEVVNTIAEPLVNEYIETETKPSIDEYVNGLKPSLQAYVNQASNYANNSQTSAKASAASSATALTSANNAKTSETNAKTSETNALSSKNAAASSATASGGYANNAKIWAEGTDAQVQALGGEKSAKGWAKASTNLDYTNITNCITEIPQDIKLELNNGTLTLKAGSKVYVPNGANKFDEGVVSADRTYKYTAEDSTRLLMYDTDEWYLYTQSLSNCYSGATAPTGTATNAYWYDTTNNQIKITTNGGSTWTANKGSLPLGIIKVSGGKITSIDQVFNGFGYIGSTIFALPGVKGLTPNGRNTDGSLKNIELDITKVLTRTLSATFNNGILSVNKDDINVFNFLDSKPTSGYATYQEDENLNYLSLVKTSYSFQGRVTTSSGRITSFTPKTAFHAVDYNDFNKLDEEAARLAANNTFTGSNKFNNIIMAPGVAYINSEYANGFADSLFVYDSNKNWWAQIRVRNNSNAFGFIGIYVNEETGKVLTYAPTPPASDNSTQIATTAWVRTSTAGIPNYAAGITITADGTYTTPSKGVLMANAKLIDNWGVEQMTLVIDGQTFYFGNGTVNLDNPHIGQVYFPMKKGQSYTITVKDYAKLQVMFFPFL